MSIFSLMLLALTALLGFGAWARQVAPPLILDGIRNWAIIFLAAALPAYSWQSWTIRGVRQHRIDLRGTALLFVITLCGLCAILLLRAALVCVGLSGSTVLFRCIQVLDLAAALILPMACGFMLIMLPYVSLRGMRRVAKLLAACCLLALTLLVVTIRVTSVHMIPKRTTTPTEYPRPHGRSLA